LNFSAGTGRRLEKKIEGEFFKRFTRPSGVDQQIRGRLPARCIQSLLQESSGKVISSFLKKFTHLQ